MCVCQRVSVCSTNQNCTAQKYNQFSSQNIHSLHVKSHTMRCGLFANAVCHFIERIASTHAVHISLSMFNVQCSFSLFTLNLDSYKIYKIKRNLTRYHLFTLLFFYTIILFLRLATVAFKIYLLFFWVQLFFFFSVCLFKQLIYNR